MDGGWTCRFVASVPRHGHGEEPAGLRAAQNGTVDVNTFRAKTRPPRRSPRPHGRISGKKPPWPSRARPYSTARRRSSRNYLRNVVIMTRHRPKGATQEPKMIRTWTAMLLSTATVAAGVVVTRAAQAPPRFEVASIRPSDALARVGGLFEVCGSASTFTSAAHRRSISNSPVSPVRFTNPVRRFARPRAKSSSEAGGTTTPSASAGWRQFVAKDRVHELVGHFAVFDHTLPQTSLESVPHLFEHAG